ncbi:Short chain enoyl-CoA hydratase (fragment) [Agrobacterium deltaense NCPPB 1641]|uniref:Short chain enoyl-CoA hydratase n=2 Tax=Rhizobium/Agrobacterium group TaxID=227290 RepID=A0A1S7U8N0_9HYPH
MIMTGRTVRTEEALAIGFVHRTVTEVNKIAFPFARQFSEFSLVALGYAQDAVRRALSTTLQDRLKIEAEISTIAFQPKDAQEGITAFSKNERQTLSIREQRPWMRACPCLR